MNSNQKALKSGIWYTFSNFLLKGIDFLTIPIFARIMSQDEFGSYNNFASWVQIVLIIGTLYLTPSLYSAVYDFKDKINNYIKSILYLGSFIATLELILLTFFCKEIERVANVEYKFILLMFIYAAFRPAFEIFITHERIKYNYQSSVLVTMLSSLSSVCFALLLVAFADNKFEARVYGTYVPLIIVSLILYLRLILQKSTFDKNAVLYSVKICLPFVPHALSMTVLSSTDRIMITKYCGTTDTALYSLAYTCALAVTVLWSSLNTAFSPWLCEKIQSRSYDVVNLFSQKYVLLVAIPVIGLVLIAPELLLIVGGKQYLEAIYLIPPVMAGCYIQFIYSMYVNIEQFLKSTGFMAVASVCGASLNLVLNYVFIPIYGYMAAAYTTLLGYLFLFLFHYIIVKKLKMTKLYNSKFIIISILTVVLASLTITLIYEHSFIRYSLVTVYFLFVISLIKRLELLKDFIRGKRR